MRDTIIDVVIKAMTNLILPLLKDILFEKWKEHHSKEKEEKQD
ncbi:MAG: hypothetical protein PUI05_03645 [Peptoniphilaceae bacterium]|nr:hypothetical protein [Peptoniphilaceae bacterium]